MRLGPFTILRTKALSLMPLSSRGGWLPWHVVRESFTGAWQSNVELRASPVLMNPTLFAVVTLIAADIAKLCLRLVEEEEPAIWTPVESPAFSPVLRRPNHFQTITEFIEGWMISKLTQGNTYVLLERDQRRVVRAMYVLDPSRVTPLVTPSGDIYYELRRDDLSGQSAETVTVPASEIAHDRMPCLFHPLIGVTPIYACGAAALQGLTMSASSSKFFSNGAQPGGVLIAPKGITDVQAAALKTQWQTEFSGDNFGKIAVLGGELTYNPIGMNTAVDSELIKQMNWADEKICSTYHTPPYMVGVGPPPPYANVEPLLQAYWSQCIQSHVIKLEGCLDHALGIDVKIDGTQYGTEFDIDDLIWMDTATRMKAAGEGIRSGLSVDEVRKRYHGAKPVTGGNVVYMQEQNHSLEALAAIDAATIDAATAPPPPPPAALPPADPDDDDLTDDDLEKAVADLLTAELTL
jgi:HK97 family phage portal protein